MSTYSLTLRGNLNRRLTIEEMDSNFLYLQSKFGGDITQNTEISFDGGTDQPMGLWLLPDGVQGDPSPYLFFGMHTDPNDSTKSNGVSVGLVNDIIETVIVGNDKSVGEFVKLADGSGQIDLEVNSPDGSLTYALKMSPGLLTFGDYINASDIYLLLVVEFGKYEIGDLGGFLNSTKVTIDDVNQLVKITNVPTYADDASAITGGLSTGHLYKTTTGGITSLNIVP